MKVSRTTKQYIEVPNVFRDITTTKLAEILGADPAYASRLRNEKVPLSEHKYMEMKSKVDAYINDLTTNIK